MSQQRQPPKPLLDTSSLQENGGSVYSTGSNSTTNSGNSTNNNNISSNNNDEVRLSQRRKELFGDCALIEIIHLHDCLRGALKALESDVVQLATSVRQDAKYCNDSNDSDDFNNNVQDQPQTNENDNNRSSTTTANANAAKDTPIDTTTTTELERRVAGRFKVIWTVFKSHSHAEDEFIWPALKTKTRGRIQHHHNHNHNNLSRNNHQQYPNNNNNDNQNVFIMHPIPPPAEAAVAVAPDDVVVAPANAVLYNQNNLNHNNNNNNNHHDFMEYSNTGPVIIEQEEYEEDHADEERMFKQMDTLLTKLREALLKERQAQNHHIHQKQQLPSHENQKNIKDFHGDSDDDNDDSDCSLDETTNNANCNNMKRSSKNHTNHNNNHTIIQMADTLLELTQELSRHLMVHLQKEEMQCMPLVAQHLSKAEIHELVGQIMGQRSADMIAQIMTMAIQNLEPDDRNEMVKYMKQSMAGTFFDRWLLMSGWMKDIDHATTTTSTTTSTSHEINSSHSQHSEDSNPSNNNDNNNNDISDRKPSPADQQQQNDDYCHDNISLVTTKNSIAQIVTTPSATKKSSKLMIDAAKKRALLTFEQQQQQQQQETEYCNQDVVQRPEQKECNPSLRIDDTRKSLQKKRLKTNDENNHDNIVTCDPSCNHAMSETGTHSSSSSNRADVTTNENNSACTSSSQSNNNCYTSSTMITSQAELERLIRAIATNPSLTAAQKNTTIQGLRDSVWKSNQRHKQMHEAELPTTLVNRSSPGFIPFSTTSTASPPRQQQRNCNTNSSCHHVNNCRTRRVTPPSVYYKKNQDGKIETVWPSAKTALAATKSGNSTAASSTLKVANSLDNSGSSSNPGVALTYTDPPDVPLFSASELAPTYHDGAAGAVLGCPHYARACKIRHPISGRLYTCLICCSQQRELPMKDQDDPLDRYAVTEVMCMVCNALQPAEDRCINPDCESYGKPFAKYFCRICHLYDDGSRPIFHCPYCNICRLGLGLGIDYRHCMRCNACVSLSDKDHRCLPQKLQGSCPICRENLFQSTEPLRGLKCGHVLHLSCFEAYQRGQNYTCPLCMRSMDDMKDYFAMLDMAIRMQPMPLAYLNTMSNIYCQDCNQTGRVPYHFVGQKCPQCGSYNTRELGRFQASPASSPRVLNPIGDT